ncbi:hypothetical protein Bca52824_006468 [Brassica carinata]|uniref:GRF-type domain-containing protein n=1 Tax=Brassica carinata TaxID=52824 RepID=A0A8X8B5Z2_BRACI|nr:hypothetical protein Bca52824_006468 [Brassica carinata]
MGDTGRGFPTHCRCGARVSRHTSRTRTNPGRLFHSCPYGDENNRHHLFKWTDESMVEEIEDLKERFDAFKRGVLSTNKDSKICESDIETLTSETQSCNTLVHGYENEIRGIENDITDLRMEFKSFKNMLRNEPRGNKHGSVFL